MNKFLLISIVSLSLYAHDGKPIKLLQELCVQSVVKNGVQIPPAFPQLIYEKDVVPEESRNAHLFRLLTQNANVRNDFSKFYSGGPWDQDDPADRDRRLCLDRLKKWNSQPYALALLPLSFIMGMMTVDGNPYWALAAFSILATVFGSIFYRNYQMHELYHGKWHASSKFFLLKPETRAAYRASGASVLEDDEIAVLYGQTGIDKLRRESRYDK